MLTSAASAVAAGVETVTAATYTEIGAGGWLVPVSVLDQYLLIVSAASGALLIATYPDGVPERRWQRVVSRALWWQLAVPPLLLLTSPDVVVLPYLLPPETPRVPSPVAVDALAWAAPPLRAILLDYVGVMVGVAVLLVRYAVADAAGRRRMRLLVYAALSILGVLVAQAALHAAGVPQTSPWWACCRC